MKFTPNSSVEAINPKELDLEIQASKTLSKEGHRGGEFTEKAKSCEDT